MKSRDLIRAILAAGCVFVREGGNHSVYLNPRTARNIIVPRHAEVKEHLARSILAMARA